VEGRRSRYCKANRDYNHDIEVGPVESHWSQNNLPGTSRTSEKYIIQRSVECIAQERLK
jgi:hypothetical protein